jgi:hypothetical protein
MSLIKKAGAQKHFSVSRTKSFFPLKCPRQEDTIHWRSGPRDARVNVPSSPQDSSATAPIAPIEVLRQQTPALMSHTIFLRTGCALPEGLDVTQEQFCEKAFPSLLLAPGGEIFQSVW